VKPERRRTGLVQETSHTPWQYLSISS